MATMQKRISVTAGLVMAALLVCPLIATATGLGIAIITLVPSALSS